MKIDDTRIESYKDGCLVLKESVTDKDLVEILGTITSDDVIKKLDIGETQVKDLSPVAEKFPDLEELNISCSEVVDLSPIQALGQLHILHANATDIKSLAPLANLTNLEGLNLEDINNVTDITPLSHLTKLKKLDLLGNEQISDIVTTLLQLKSLEDLCLTGTQITEEELYRLVDLPLTVLSVDEWFEGASRAVLDAVATRREKTVQKAQSPEQLVGVSTITMYGQQPSQSSKDDAVQQVRGELDTIFMKTFTSIAAIMSQNGIGDRKLADSLIEEAFRKNAKQNGFLNQHHAQLAGNPISTKS